MVFLIKKAETDLISWSEAMLDKVLIENAEYALPLVNVMKRLSDEQLKELGLELRSMIEPKIDKVLEENINYAVLLLDCFKRYNADCHSLAP